MMDPVSRRYFRVAAVAFGASTKSTPFVTFVTVVIVPASILVVRSRHDLRSRPTQSTHPAQRLSSPVNRQPARKLDAVNALRHHWHIAVVDAAAYR